MDKIKTPSLKRSMTITFLITICVIAILSGITIFTANQVQQKILEKRYLTIKPLNFQLDENTGAYVFDINNSEIEWQSLSVGDNAAYYGCYVAMIGLPILYIVGGIGAATAIYYRRKLRTPIAQLQNGIESIQNNDLDFNIKYDGDDELGRLCRSMEKMRKELRQNNKALWESLEQRKLLNASVAHDLRTPITVLKGYLDYLEKNIPQDKLTEDMLMETLSSMQGAATRLQHYVDCVRDIEKIENIEIKREPQNTAALLNEIESDIRLLAKDKEIIFTGNISTTIVNIDKSVFFRIIDNLVQNALRYAEKQVDVHFSRKNKFIVVTVKDDGQGFTDTDLMQATTLFYSKDKGNEHFGIGLTICKLLCEKHGGLLCISNIENSGACVTAKIEVF